MEHRFGAGPDPADLVPEGESRSFRRIQGGDAAKAAEQSTPDADPFHNTFAIHLRATRGARFELEKNPERQEEAPSVVASVDSEGQALPAAADKQQPEATAGITKRLFQRLFRPGARSQGS